MNPQPINRKILATLLLLLIPTMLIAACTQSTPDQGSIETAIAQTQAAKKTATPTFLPTYTFTPTDTPVLATKTPTITPSPTNTPTFTPSPTPDLRVIIDDPQKYILKSEDLPADSQYYLPGPNWTSPHKNTEILSGWGQEEGRKYIEETGRIESWWVRYKRGSQKIRAPERMLNNVIIFRTAIGAQLSLSDYNRVVRQDDPGYRWEWSEKEPSECGDMGIAFLDKERQPNGKYKIWYEITCVYRNVAVIVGGYGWEDEVTHEFVERAAKLVIEKLKTAPLSEPE